MGLDKALPRYRALLRWACERGDADALYCLADCHYHGSDGFNQDNRRALALYKEAADAGHYDAMYCLGAMHFYGQGTASGKADPSAAAEWYHLAADKCLEADGEVHQQAWQNLAGMYALGQGVRRCEETANQILSFLEQIRNK